MAAILGFCGTGLMGAPMVGRLLKAGHCVHVWNRTPNKAKQLAQDGAILHESPSALAAHCDIIFLCLGSEEAVTTTVFGQNGLSQSGRALIVDHSSLSPQTTQNLAQQWMASTGKGWIDAPVSGGVAGAQSGTLTIMAGGQALDIAYVQPYIQAYAARFTHMGPTGAGQVTKLCNQTIVAATVTAIAEAVALADKSGIDSAKLHQALAGGWADSTLLQLFVPRMTGPVHDKLGAVNTMAKDVNNAVALAAQTNAGLRVLQAVQNSFQHAQELGLSERDLSTIVQVAQSASALPSEHP